MLRYILILILSALTLSSGFSQNNYFVFLNTNPEREELSTEKVDSIQNAHMDNIKRLASLNKLIVAGPFDGGGGIFVFHAASASEVWSLLKTDPAVAANRFNPEVFIYRSVKGGICQVGSDYTMVTHSFLRIWPSSPSDSASIGSVLRELRDVPEMLAAGELGNGEGGIILYDDPSFEATFDKITSKQKRKLNSLIKKLWIAKGSFCEAR